MSDLLPKSDDPTSLWGPENEEIRLRRTLNALKHHVMLMVEDVECITKRLGSGLVPEAPGLAERIKHIKRLFRG